MWPRTVGTFDQGRCGEGLQLVEAISRRGPWWAYWHHGAPWHHGLPRLPPMTAPLIKEAASL